MQKKAIGTVYALCFFFLCAGLFFASGMQQINGSRMNSLFVKHAVPFVQERFTPDEMRSIAEGLCAFLRNGDRSSLLIGTQSDPVFSAREMLHLADCAELFSRIRFVKNGLLFVPALVLAFAFSFRRIRRYFSFRMIRRCLRIGTAAFLLCLASLLLYGAVDFERFFIFFHRILFSNELWVMNAQQDLLVQLMPLSFFTEYAERILITGIIAVIGTEFAFEIVFFLLMKRNSKPVRQSLKPSGAL